MREEPKTMRLAGIVRESIVDGPGFRFCVFCQGCPHDCPGCHNMETHDFQSGREVELARILEEIDKNPMLSGVTFTGGEPFCQPEAFAALDKWKAKHHAWRIRERTLFLVALLGGGFGVWAGMYLFRHKTKHWYFVWGIPLLTCLVYGLLGWLLLQPGI